MQGTDVKGWNPGLSFNAAVERVRLTETFSNMTGSLFPFCLLMSLSFKLSSTLFFKSYKIFLVGDIVKFSSR